ncbi:hypothetical protein EMQ25_12990 [Arsenicitalea aurantiaca]|uniref:Putative Flp pilus-assembly TadG-like N-terminal domain-containing protein n=1 Tax=Arsenicitalea aurantiaca TaxID=1783274 RepID=A0A433X836_9HYPH|nr:pilus assembly protein TadG-related protein [Arsenicitalea aurantiaca]RUT30225.1 hypothetical protein EMQ25_12990 [Arsenicitalea aurantiaca]
MAWPELGVLRARRPRRFIGAQSGSVAVIFALTLPVILGVSALVAEYGAGLIDHSENQRIADLAAYAGALAFSATSDEDAMDAAARAIVTANGRDGATAVVELVSSPRSADNQAVHVRVNSENRLILATILPGVADTLAIRAEAFAELGSAPRQMAGCILALSGVQSGVTLTGGTSIVAHDCAVSSNNTVTVPCGTGITAAMVNYNSGTPPNVGCNGISGPVNRAATEDPLADASGVILAQQRMPTVAALTGPAAPAAPLAPTVPNGTNVNLAWNSQSGVPSGCTAVWTTTPSARWTMSCNSGQTYNFGNFTIGGGIQLVFQTNGAQPTTYNFTGTLQTASTMSFGNGNYNFRANLQTAGTTTFGNGNIHVGGNLQLTGTNTFGNGNKTVVGNFTTSGGGVQSFGTGNVHVGGDFTLNASGGHTFGAGNFTLAKGLRTGGGTVNTFGAGTYRMGRNASDCSGGGLVSICNTSTLTIAGPSTFELHSGFFNTGGARLNLGVGTASSFWFGPSSSGQAIRQGGGAITVMGDQTTPAPRFEMAGHVDVASGGGSCLTIPAAAHHDIRGDFTSAGGTIMGAGVYTIDGHFALGANGGGAVTCNGTSVGLHGTGVTIVLSGRTTSTSWACQNQVFCVTAGYSNVRLLAPTTGPYTGLAVVGPTDPTITHGAVFSGGADAVLSGAFYLPNGPISMTGGASIGGAGGAERCLQLVGSRITLEGGTTAASECVLAEAEGGANGGRVRLVQ